MAGYVKPAVWDRIKTIFRNFHEDVEKMPVIWYRSKGGLDLHYGDKPLEAFTTINLTGLIEYNFRRSWPINTPTPSGTIDGEHCRLILNKAYLSELGYIDAKGYFAFNPNADRFEIEGKRYKSLGDSSASQNAKETLLTTLILKRESEISPNAI